MSGWRAKTIADLGKVVTGSTPASRNPGWFGDSTPFVTPSDITDGDRRPRPERWLSDQGRTGLKTRLVPAESVAFVCIGATIGKVCLLPSESVTNQQINTVIPGDETDGRFVYYLLRHVAPSIAQAASGAATPIINKSAFSGIPINAPDFATQSRIGEVLGCLDDLIENNRRRVKVLEEMARAIYREWFVKFRYPGHEDVPMVDSALGLIPVGWGVGPLAAIADVNSSSRKPAADEMFKYLDISALSEREIGELDLVVGSDAPGRARRLLRAGDTVWATVRPNRRAHALVVSPGEDWIASTGLAVLSPTSVSPAYLFEMTSAAEFSDWLVGRATGSAYPAVRAKDFEEALVVVPEAGIDCAFAEKVAPMHELCWKLRAESAALGGLRDLLLPKLVTGQIDVSALDLDALIAEQVA